MKITGIITAMVTPLSENGIDEAATRKLVNKLINDGVHGLFILGTNGEFYALSEEEKLTLVKIVVDEAAGRVPIFAGSGGISTEAVIQLTNQFAELGVDAVSIITPYLIKISDGELIQHYQTIASNTNLPIILYNIPANTKISISEQVFKELIKIPRIVGIKDSSGQLENIQMYLDLNDRADFSVLVGSDSLILPALQKGADGAVAATSNVLTKTDLGIYQAYLANDLEKAARLQESINDFRRVLKLATVPSVLKYSLGLTGIPVGPPKSPVRGVTPELDTEIRNTLALYKEIEGMEKLSCKN
ncbi:4-hydroxy-tetrahydrodipicolinate synthase [Enterococcus hulanensis]|uniref:4-hydroxy-tetrahydrodipicolinate synthase n=1 Tax=Enterococcus hulanensis TaxID=2559929 RepID=A0ABU3ETU1_9ENTE|nr:4-hydroxy-tetrahydrodipicolinate synthase [Enterococcus hulanensis]MDT2598290.1 4-hydroxy-tetrahydrodipicolinate synthase [Enterococcus hulanensis]MDT2608205.1 4-hydroxy-tetrahydrodipicolinate synthase [Enterococcus hulanensis]MDT2615500.1 4-hydroxy-tetrahydrodipicolinate synthase [Enterococcus hulanensis]MDT2626529.1 4-hydroxy-tetrahydrodipicolinate synthase [Enterococcus hulanensis]MDT2654572.1 4-hydroxy-tetrahydrodipicolinate synthase [Enterococcus hulanensis]